MSDLDPAIWDNPTLGSATTNPFLDEVEAQQAEDLNAKKEGRTPRIAVHEPRFPQFLPSHSVPSNINQISLVDAVTPNASATPTGSDAESTSKGSDKGGK